LQKEDRAFFIADEKVSDEIRAFQKVAEPSPANRSVLHDPYYVVQFETLEAKDFRPMCESFKSMVDYKLCYFKMDGIYKKTKEFGVWQLRAFSLMLRMLQRIPDAAFIDAGANAGYLTVPLMVAMGGKRKAIAVEALEKNVLSIMWGVKSNGLPTHNWAVINRALTDSVDEKLSFKLGINETAGTFETIDDPNKIFPGRTIDVLTATLDSHVLPVAKAMNITTAILKIDIEGSECAAVQAAQKLLREIDIPYIMLETALYARFMSDSCLERMFSVLHKFSYVPFKPDSVGVEGMLNPEKYKTWVYYDVIWKKIL